MERAGLGENAEKLKGGERRAESGERRAESGEQRAEGGGGMSRCSLRRRKKLKAKSGERGQKHLVVTCIERSFGSALLRSG